MDKVQIMSPLRIVGAPNKALASVGNETQPDLLYMDSVLVSTGQNKNDDIFLPHEMWAARKSPILKPVDWEHNTGSELIESATSNLENPKKIVADNQIIGVMYNSYAANKDGSKIDEAKISASDFKPPRSFDIINQAVIYKYLFPKVAARIVQQANAGELFVSMEAWFGDYDYKIGNKIVARNKDTNFLDKHLRAYGGDGLYVGQSIGRVLRKIVFGGVGLVANPANIDSVIHSFTNASSDISMDDKIVNHVIAEITNQEVVEIMAEKTEKPADNPITGSDYKEVVQLLAKAEAALATKSAELTAAQTEVKKLSDSVENVSNAFISGSKSLESLVGVDAAQKLVSAGASNFFTVLADVVNSKISFAKDLEAKLDVAAKKIAAFELEKKVSARLSKITELLAPFVTDATKLADRKAKISKATELLSDEAFAAYLADTKELLAEAASDSKDSKDAKPSDLQDDETDDEDTTSASEGITDIKILENVTASVKVPAGKSDIPGVDIVDKYKSLASELISVLGNNNPKKTPGGDK